MEGGLVGNRTFEEYIAYYEDLYGEDMDVWMGKKHISLRTRLTQFYEKFGDSYDYSEMGVPGKSRDKIKVICRKHGEFSRVIHQMVGGTGCPECQKMKTDEERRQRVAGRLLDRFREQHGDKYDYSLVEYVDQYTKIKIICPEHGMFEQTPAIHSKYRCPKCGIDVIKSKLTVSQEEMIKRFRKAHGDRYDYSLVEYVNNNTPVKIICPEHGVFEQLPRQHISKKPGDTGRGCPKCGAEIRAKAKSKSNEEWIAIFHELHGDKFDYSQSDFYGGKRTKVHCVKHDFWFTTTSQRHQTKNGGCKHCVKDDQRTFNLVDQDEIIKRFREVHGEKYDYSKVVYTGSSKKVKIVCPEHGEFLQKPSNHLNGKGCQTCSESKAETRVRVFLENHNIAFEREQTYAELIDKYVLRFDFFIPSLNLLVECHGQQHYFPVTKFGGEERFKTQIRCDKKKIEYAKKNGINYLEIPFWLSKKEVESLLKSVLVDENRESMCKYKKSVIEARETFYKLFHLYPNGNLIYGWKTNQKMDEEISVFCYKHKTFKETPNNLLKGIHCPECMKEESKDE